MLVIARQIDMPDEFVALRHEATHEDLPSVQRLVAVCEQALEWLWRVYWSRLPDEPVKAAVEVARTKEVDIQQVRDGGRKLLKEFRSARKQGLKVKGGTTAKSQVELVNKTAGEFETLCRNQESAIVALTETLLDEKMLYPSDRGYVPTFILRGDTNSTTDSLQIRRCYERRISPVGCTTTSHVKTTTPFPLETDKWYAYALEPAKRLPQRPPRPRERSAAPLATAHRLCGRLVAGPPFYRHGRGS